VSQTVEVRFKGTRKAYFLWSGGETLRTGDAVVVEVERGRDLGRVTAIGDVAEKKCGGGCSGCAVGGEAEEPAPLKQVLSRALAEEVKTHEEIRRSEEDARRKVVQRARAHDLVMKVSDTEWQWDRNKLTIYFTAEKRVDFRALVRDLASTFRTRIELRQIGVRDEAAQLSGVGRCGREYCCSSWLKELSPVNLGLAKDQHLSLNPTQISGGCGRLLCCLKYEHEFYVAARRRFPKEGKTIRTSLGPERVVAVDIFRERVFLRHDEEGPRIVSLAELRDELDRLGEPPPEHRGPRPSIAHAAPKPAPAAPPARERASGRHPVRPRDATPAPAVEPPEPIRDIPTGPIPDLTIAEPAAHAPRTPLASAGQPRVPLAPNAESPGPAAPLEGGGPQGTGDRKRRRRRRRGRRGDGPAGPPPPET
jgi:cell fate regulator YaaT (PSP1 superfamily)